MAEEMELEENDEEEQKYFDDAYEGVTSEEVEEVEEVEEKQEAPWQKLENRLRTMEGRYGSLNSTLNTVTSELHKIASTAKDGPTKKEVDEAVASGSLAALAEEYPDIGGKMLEMDSRFQSQLDDLKKTKPAVFDEKEFRQKVMMDNHYMGKEQVTTEDGVETRVPVDWEEILPSPEFNAWYAEQPEKIQALARSPYARDAMKLLDSYLGLDDDPPKKNQQRRLEAAVSPTNRRASSGSRATTEQEAFEQGYKKGRL